MSPQPFKPVLSAMCCIVMCLLAACNSGANVTTAHRDPTTITRLEAEAILKEAQKYAQAQDAKQLCALTGGEVDAQGEVFDPMCRDLLASRGGWAAVPSQEPRIVDDYSVPDVPHPSGGYVPGGRVLVLEGTDGLGRPYRNEFMVLGVRRPGPLGTGLGAPIPLYWINNNTLRSKPNSNGVIDAPAAAPGPTPTP